MSDIQIRNFKRHAEFRESFENLYTSLREQNLDIIVMPGDIAHSKTTVSAELFQMLTSFLSNLADIAPLYVIPGNHDLNISNLSRLDVITPIVEALDNPNIHYYLHSGIYKVNDDVDLVVFSCIDDNWPKKENINKDKINIGLYHGMVNGAVLQNGMVVEDCPYTTKQFLEIVDYLMMGDIHRQQMLDENCRAAYCGSYPQQSFGEQITKGYLLWDVESKDKHEVDFIKLPNVCPFYIIELPDDLKLTEQLDIQKNARIRIDSRQLTPTEKNVLRAQVSKFYSPKELTLKDDINAHKQSVKISKNIKIEDLSDVGVQNKLLRKFLEPHELSSEMLDFICNDLNKKYDSAIRQDEEVIRNVQYKFGKSTWNNLLSYGEGNSFDFSKRKGLVGIFGPNAAGKSTLAVTVPLYIIFNTNAKGVVKNDHLINDKKESCGGTFEIEIGDTTYKISRETSLYLKSGKKKGAPVFQGKTDLTFTKKDINGEHIHFLDEQQRQATDKQVRKVFGSSEDFLMTSVAAQFDLLNFINKKDTERQKTIGRYFDVDSFEKKHKLANDDAKEIKGQLKALEMNFQTLKEDDVAAIKKIDEEVIGLKEHLSLRQQRVEDLVVDIELWSEKVLAVSLDESKTEEFFIEAIQLKKVECLNKKNEIDNLDLSKKRFEQRLSQLLEKIDEIKIEKLERQKNAWVKKAGNPSVGKMATLVSMVDSFDKSIEELKKYGCINNDDCCMLDELKRVEEEKNITLVEKEDLCEKTSEYIKILNEHIVPLDDKISDYYEDIDTSLSLTKQVDEQRRFIDTHQELLGKLMAEVFELETKKQFFIKNKNQIEKNNKYREKITVLKLEKDNVSEFIRAIEKDIFVCESDRKQHWDSHSKIEVDELLYNEFKEKHDAYFYYLEATGKDGLSRIIINNNLDIINIEIAKILSGNVNFSIELEANEVGKIEIYFKHNKSKTRRIELCSGMEKTIAAIAIRAALVCVTTLPKANVFVLDEVFASLDPKYLDATRKILEYLKNLFDSVIIITHIDGFKDLVDHVVEIHRDDQGFARIS